MAVSSIIPGAYGEQLGIFPDAMVSDVGYAGYVDDRNTTGLMYTPNRYLGLNASFMSVDPSGSINIHDPRTFNQYAYVAGNPLTFVDPAGLDWFLVSGTWQWHKGSSFGGQSGYSRLVVATTTEIRSDGSQVYAVQVWDQDTHIESLDSIAYSGGALGKDGKPSDPIPNGNYLVRADLPHPAPSKVDSDNPNHYPPADWGIQPIPRDALLDERTGKLWLQPGWGSIRAHLIPMDGSEDQGLYLHGQSRDYRALQRTHGCLTTSTDERILYYLYNLKEKDKVPVAVNTPVELPK